MELCYYVQGGFLHLALSFVESNADKFHYFLKVC